MRVLRYELAVGDNVVSLPEGARVLSCAVRPHAGHVDLWVMAPAEAATTDRLFQVVGTGWEFGDDAGLTYIGTAVTASGSYVWHVFERAGVVSQVPGH